MVPCIGVAEYFAGKSVFITGATGFMGRVLVEKLLRSCPDVKTLYLLMRSKKGLSIEERLQSYVNCEVFNRIQAECPKSLHKLRLVSGDVLADQLGICILDQEELQREVQIIFHCAASVRFDMFIRDAVQINVCGTLKMLKFADTMKNLEVFLHMSTAYCHDDLDLLEEKLYSAKHQPEDIMNMMRWMDDDMLRSIEHKLIHPLPNTYSYTKALSEDLVAQFAGKFPIAIARPSIVQKRLHHGLNVLSHYMTGQWVFKNDLFISLRERLNKEEREIFYTEYEKIEVHSYTKNYVKGARQYCCKELPSTLPKARRMLKMLYYVQLTFKMIFLWWFLCILYFGVMKTFSNQNNI